MFDRFLCPEKEFIVIKFHVEGEAYYVDVIEDGVEDV